LAVTVSDSTVRLSSQKLGIDSQKPEYPGRRRRDEREIEYFLNVKFPAYNGFATKLGGRHRVSGRVGVGIMTRYGEDLGGSRTTFFTVPSLCVIVSVAHPDSIEDILFCKAGTGIEPGRASLERDQKQPHRKATRERIRRI